MFAPTSTFAPGDIIRLHPSIGKALGHVKRVSFSKSKVTFDIALCVGGETLRNVDSCFVCSPLPGDIGGDLE